MSELNKLEEILWEMSKLKESFYSSSLSTMEVFNLLRDKKSVYDAMGITDDSEFRKIGVFEIRKMGEERLLDCAMIDGRIRFCKKSVEDFVSRNSNEDD